MKLIKAIGLILALIGIVVLGFLNIAVISLGFTSLDFGQINFPFIDWILPFLGILGQTVEFWNLKLWAGTFGIIGLLLVRFG